MAKKNTTITYYEMINKLYSINYSSLRLYEQNKAKMQKEGFRFKMPYEMQESWVDAKISDVNTIRAQFFEAFNEANEISKEQFIYEDNQLERSKELLHLMHNTWYEKEGSFEDVFDGFLCKSPEMLQLLYIFEMQPFMTNNPAVMHLVQAYSSYIVNLFNKTISQSMFDIIEQLNNDFNSNGTPSLYSGIIKKDNVLKISSKQLEEKRQQVEAIRKQLKEIKPKKYSGDAYTHTMLTNKCLEFSNFLEQLEKRLKCANTDVVNNVKNRILEGTMDYLTGSKLEKNPEVKEIYVTELELNYIKYLNEMISYGLACLNEHKKQENKEKGETQ